MQMFTNRRFRLLLLVMNIHFFQGSEMTLAETTTLQAADVILDPTDNLSFCIYPKQVCGPLTIQLLKDGNQIAEAEVKTQGAFAFRGFAPGSYQIYWGSPDVGYRTKIVRLWNHRQAPPSAKNYLELEENKSVVVRGQYGGDGGSGSNAPAGMRQIFRNPWISAGVISAAIAVPIAVYYDDYDAS